MEACEEEKERFMSYSSKTQHKVEMEHELETCRNATTSLTGVRDEKRELKKAHAAAEAEVTRLLEQATKDLDAVRQAEDITQLSERKTAVTSALANTKMEATQTQDNITGHENVMSSLNVSGKSRLPLQTNALECMSSLYSSPSGRSYTQTHCGAVAAEGGRAAPRACAD